MGQPTLWKGTAMPDARDVTAYLKDNKALRDALGLTVPSTVDVRMLARGEYNQNFVFRHPQTGRDFLFRVNLGSQMHLEDQISYEARALELLAPSGRTPQVLYVDGSKAFFGRGVLVEEFLPGRPLDYTTDLAQAAHILADIHSVPVPVGHGLIAPERPLVSMLEECDAMFLRYRGWDGADPQVRRRIEGWFEQAWEWAHADAPAPRRHIISTELNSGNFLINEGAPSYLIDWEKPLVGEVEQDLAHFLVPTTTFWKTDIVLADEAVLGFIGLYRDAVAGRFDTTHLANRLHRYLAITCLRGITWCAMALAQHVCGEREVADAYTLEKTKAYLEDDFLFLIEEGYYGL